MHDGTYGVRTPQPRQRYRCYPQVADEDGTRRAEDPAREAEPAGNDEAAAREDHEPHTGTPPLARHHVHRHEGGRVECEELRGVHHGETAVARQHSWPMDMIARARSRLADAGSYGDVSRQALAQAERAAARHEALSGAG